MEKLSVSYSTISRVLLNKTINRLTKISFHKHFKVIFIRLLGNITLIDMCYDNRIKARRTEVSNLKFYFMIYTLDFLKLSSKFFYGVELYYNVV